MNRQLQGKDFLGHPSGLYVLFFTEMWERFSYYGMRALLILYMVKHLFADSARAEEVIGYATLVSTLSSVFGEMNVQALSSQVYGLYTGLVYFTPLFGGIIADKYLGQYRTVYLGGILMAIGHFLMASESAFLIALFFLILGNGCFKPNISTQVGSLYPEGDPRRDRAFTIFYMGINLGAFLSPLVCGTLGETLGWHWGFGAAGVGMLLGLVVYWAGADLVPKESSGGSVKVIEKRPLTKQEWNAVYALGLMCILNITFWAIFEQQGNTLQLWSTDRTDWVFFGIEIPSTWVQSFNPFFIFIFAPVLNIVWKWQSNRGTEPSSVGKMGIGCVLCGAAYIFMIVAALVVPADEKGSLIWLTGTIFIFTMGELFLSPIGLSLVTKIAPKPILGTMMGMWFLSSFFGNYMTGFLGTFYGKMADVNFFAMLCGLGVVTGLIFFMVKRPMEKVIGKHV